MIKSDVPTLRIENCNTCKLDPEGDFVLYWMIANRRLEWNFSLQRAVEYAQHLNKPLVILEALRSDYRWNSDRIHRFILQGMRDNERAARDQPVLYYPFVETKKNGGKGLLAALSKHACVIVTDDFPCFMLPRMVEAAAKQVKVKMEKVDSNGLLPLRAGEKAYPTAYSFRRFLQKTLPKHLGHFPASDPFEGAKLAKLETLPKSIVQKWSRADLESLTNNGSNGLEGLPIDHTVEVVATEGGAAAARSQLDTFLEERLDRYAEQRNEPQKRVTSELSPYLHFGHISVHQIFTELMSREGWSSEKLAPKGNGSRSGWWGARKPVESFLDELITWREVGYNMCVFEPKYDRYESLPDWAQETLADHAGDKREYVYELEEFENAQTHDPLWNAAQLQLVREGRIHNYLRMLWGKKILEWSKSPQKALEVMIHLNNKYALDGRNPNSYSGIFWTLGRYDRAWGPERKIFGKIRFMSSANTARKFKVQDYIEKYNGAEVSKTA